MNDLKHTTRINRDMIATFPYEYVVHLEDLSVVLKTQYELPQQTRKELIGSFVFGKNEYLQGILPVDITDGVQQETQYYVAELEEAPLPVKNAMDETAQLKTTIETQKLTILNLSNVIDTLLEVLHDNGIGRLQ